jgi:CRISPR-associated protein Cmr6
MMTVEATMASNYRQCLDTIRYTNTTHPGLWLDRYLPDYDTGSGQTLVSDATKIPVPDAYYEFYLRWKAALEQGAGIVTKAATVLGRLSVGLGGESVLETAITLHHTYGVPYIPGSALKGLAANYARNRLDATAWGVKSDAYQIMFGHTASAGYVTFFDALYVPDKEHDKKPLWPDVITVHHPDYYQKGNTAPADWDSPTPIPFVTATGDYLIAIGGDPAWVQKAFEILAWALKDVGVGAKTSSGYGRLKLEGPPITTRAQIPGTTQPLPVLSATAPRLSSRGQVRYDIGKVYIADANESGLKVPVDWKALGMDALPGKTPVEYEYEDLPGGKRKVVKVTKSKG